MILFFIYNGVAQAGTAGNLRRFGPTSQELYRNETVALFYSRPRVEVLVTMLKSSIP